MLSVIIPVYNEEKIIELTLESLLNYLNKNNVNSEVLVIDDGSEDKSRTIIKEFPVIINKKRKQRGKGFSVREGVKMAEGDKILIMDADLSTPLNCIDTFLKLSENNGIVIASRALQESEVESNLFSIIMGRLGNWLINIFCVSGIKDTQCGFKLFDKKAAEKIFSKQTIDGFGFDFEILMLAQKYDFSIKEVPVEWTDKGESKVKKLDYLKTLKELVQVKINKLKNKY